VGRVRIILAIWPAEGDARRSGLTPARLPTTPIHDGSVSGGKGFVRSADAARCRSCRAWVQSGVCGS